MSMSVYQHLSSHEVVSIAVAPSQNGGPGFLLTMDAGGSLLTVFLTRAQLIALKAVTDTALSQQPILHGSERRT